MQPLAIGRAGEHLVCLDLILLGFRASLADPAAPYDVVLDTGAKLLRVQVKTTSAPSRRPNGRPCYQFELRRRHGKRRVGYSPGDFDVVALAALDIKRVGYIDARRKTRLVFATNNLRGGPRGVTFDDLTLEKLL